MTQVSRYDDYRTGNYITRHSDYNGNMTQPTQTVGDLLRDWRTRRRFSIHALEKTPRLQTGSLQHERKKNDHPLQKNEPPGWASGSFFWRG